MDHELQGAGNPFGAKASVLIFNQSLRRGEGESVPGRGRWERIEQVGDTKSRPGAGDANQDGRRVAALQDRRIDASVPDLRRPCQHQVEDRALHLLGVRCGEQWRGGRLQMNRHTSTDQTGARKTRGALNDLVQADCL